MRITGGWADAANTQAHTAAHSDATRFHMPPALFCEKREGMTKSIQKITPFLWFDHEAEEAAKFYTSQFSNSRIEAVTRYGESGPGPNGSVMTGAFELA